MSIFDMDFRDCVQDASVFTSSDRPLEAVISPHSSSMAVVLYGASAAGGAALLALVIAVVCRRHHKSSKVGIAPRWCMLSLCMYSMTVRRL